jgi:hypothetical protein
MVDQPRLLNLRPVVLSQQTDRHVSRCLILHPAVMLYKKLVYVQVNEYYVPPYMLAISWLAEKAGLPNPCCNKNLEYLFEIMQVKFPRVHQLSAILISSLLFWLHFFL